MATAEQIQHLKRLIGAVDISEQRESWVAPDLENGIPKGSVIELLGPQKYEWMIQFLKHHPQIKTFWAEREQQVLPTALHQRGLDLRQITFGLFPDAAFVPLRRIIQSQVYEVIISAQQFKELKMLRAFQLLTEKANNVLFLVSQHEASVAWPLTLQLHIEKDKNENFKIDILRQKRGRVE